MDFFLLYCVPTFFYVEKIFYSEMKINGMIQVSGHCSHLQNLWTYKKLLIWMNVIFLSDSIRSHHRRTSPEYVFDDYSASRSSFIIPFIFNVKTIKKYAKRREKKRIWKVALLFCLKFERNRMRKRPVDKALTLWMIKCWMETVHRLFFVCENPFSSFMVFVTNLKFTLRNCEFFVKTTRKNVAISSI